MRKTITVYLVQQANSGVLKVFNRRYIHLEDDTYWFLLIKTEKAFIIQMKNTRNDDKYQKTFKVGRKSIVVNKPQN